MAIRDDPGVRRASPFLTMRLARQAETDLRTADPRPDHVGPPLAGRPALLYLVRQGLPRLLTIGRGLLCVPTFWFLSCTQDPGYLASALLCSLAGLTDFLDGFLARRWHTASPQWATWDLVADKAMITLVLLGLTLRQIVPAWVIGVVALREIGVAWLRWKHPPSDSLQPDRLGKAKTAALFTAAVWVLTASHLTSAHVLGNDPVWTLVVHLTAWSWWVLAVALGLTVLSGLNYLRRAMSSQCGAKGPGGLPQPVKS